MVYIELFQVLDIRDSRVDSLLQNIIDTSVCEVPGDEPWTVEKFESRTKVSYCKTLYSAGLIIKKFTPSDKMSDRY